MFCRTRDEEVNLIKQLISGDEILCPVCKKEKLVVFHKKAKKYIGDRICPNCKTRFDSTKMFIEL